MEPALEHLTQPFVVSEWPEGFVPVEGCIHRYDAAEVNRHLSTTAVAYPVEGNRMEIYNDGERFWVVDDRWGLAEINLLKGQWRAWILDHASIDPYRALEQAVLWPMSQLLRARGLNLVPAVSVSRGDWGMLMINPFGIEPELSALIHAGFHIVGQRWTALREDDGRVSMLHVPGFVEQAGTPRVRNAGAASDESDWVDLTRDHPGVTHNHAFCDSVVLIEPGRRPIAWTRPVGLNNAAAALRRGWPILELHPQRRPGKIIPQLAAQTKISEMRLSRSPADLLARIDFLRYGDEVQEEAAATQPPAPEFITAKPPSSESPQKLGTSSRPIQTTARQVNGSTASDPAPPRNLTPWSLAG